MTGRITPSSRGGVAPVTTVRLIPCWTTRAVRRVVVLAGAAVTALTIVPAVSAPVSAQTDPPIVTGLVTVREVTDFDSQPDKTVKAKCPEGTNVVGGGTRRSAEATSG